MRKLKLIYISLLALLVLGCNKDNENDIPDYSDVSWYTEAGGFAHTNLARQVGESLSFMDLSQGIYAHEWVLDSGNFYIEGDFQKGDDLTQFIIPNSGLSTDAYNINVLFMEEGLQGVRLHNKFYHPVEYIGFNSSHDEADTLTAHRDEEGMWVIDTTFYVDVYGVLEPEVIIEKEGEMLVHVKMDSIIYFEDGEQKVITDQDENIVFPTFDIEWGEVLTYRDMTASGRPDTRTWTFPSNAAVNGYDNGGDSNVDPENAVSVDLIFNSFEKSGAGSLETERTLDVVASKAKLNLPITFNVVPPTLKAEFKVYHRGVEVLHIGEDDIPSDDISTWTTLDIALDDELVFEDLTTEITTLNRAWNFESGIKAGETGTAQNESNIYSDIATGAKIGSFTVSQTINNEEQTSTKVIPLLINVTLTQEGDTEVLGDITTADEISNTILFYSNEELKDIPASSINDFSISGTDINAAPLSLSITSVALNPDNKKEVMITLDNEVYNSDEIQLAYTGSQIKSRADIPLNAFDLPVIGKNTASDVLDATFKSFEEYKGKDTGGSAKGWISSHDGAPKDTRYFYYQRTDERASDGDYSMKFFADYNLATISKDKKVETSVSEGHILDVPEGVYEVSLDIYVEDGSITSPLDENFEIKLTGESTLSYKIDYNALPKGEWTTIKIKKPFGPSNSTTKLVLQFDSDVASSGTVHFYLDNVSMRNLKTR
ncbi:hypothetical protein [Flammeovirga sp. SJP92]|uniref:hypothetical protein n=1 Tax=Flammeovirga sp. SJP92 TaxID=1775430 RepID=UPI00078710D5|nr:hypothetical protein [Flammeovirga sp. SJP92]KXX67470.1 hypothetical protein AVL50_29505 [Flammeovirga sp. SJP92]